MKAALLALVLLAGCRDEAAMLPDPVPPDADARSYYGLMQLSGHAGPKAQIHLEGHPAPIFFAQVRDGLAYLRGTEREARVLVAYVNDMGAAPDWDEPGAENWIALDKAHFVVGAGVTGGMGAPEIVPFGDPAKAAEFAANRGGKVMPLDAIPDATLFGAVEIELTAGE